MASEARSDASVCILKGRFEVLLDSPLPLSDTARVSAFAARDKQDPDDEIFALVCDPELPPRSQILGRLKKVSGTDLVQLRDFGISSWMRGEGCRFVLIFDRPSGKRVASDISSLLVVGAGSLPTLVAFVVDIHPKKFAAWTVGLFNFAGLMPYLGKMWMKDNSIGGAMDVLTDVVAWFVIYSAAGIGWMVYKGMPVIGGINLDMKAQSTIRKLKAERQKLINEWGKQAVGGLPG